MAKASDRRRMSAEETRRQARVRSCAAHLKDLQRAHRTPPPDVALAPRSLPARIPAEPVSSGCTSPAQLCAELAQ